MLGWLLYNEQDANENKAYIEWFIYESKKQNIELQLIYRERLAIGLEYGMYEVKYDNKPISLPDFVVVRTIEPIIQYMLTALKIPTFNSYEVAKTSNHKSWTYMEMHRLGIPFLPTYFAAKKAFPKTPPIPFPFVVKEATGRGGKEVFYIKNCDDWDRLKLRIHSDDIIIQQANVQLGKDVRVFVIGKEIVAAVLRKNRKDFRANYKLGGTAELFQLNVEQIEMVKKIVNHFDFGLVGIDFLIGPNNEFMFNEIEDVVGSRILSATTEINLLEKYVSYIKQSVLVNKSQITM